ncbi:MAG: hypothetical protein U5L45_01635 [Saprospiraceae bacterium]|nr:hypothetical protein [Saprospiraceae bacterium]
MVRFSGFARKTNHIPLFCERSELWAKYLPKIKEKGMTTKYFQSRHK